MICGETTACQNHCPVMRLGRVCPTVPEFMDELEALRISPALVGRVPSPSL